MLGTIFDLRRFSIHDGPGIRTTVFFKGCPLRCAWCHNPESQSPKKERIYLANRCIFCGDCVAICPQQALSIADNLVKVDDERCELCGSCAAACVAEAAQIVGRKVSVEELLAEIERDRPFFEESGGGVTFSGGEPLMQAGFTTALLDACRKAGIHTALDTSGYTAWQTIDRLRSNVDLFLYDLKFMDSRKHKTYTGVSNRRILDNLRKLAFHGHAIWVRVPVIPGINDDWENVNGIAAFVSSLPGVARLDLLPYHRTATDKYARLQREYPLAGLATPSEERMQELVAFLKEKALLNSSISVQIGG